MLSREKNDLITQTGQGTPCGEMLRRYWQPAALVEEFANDRPIVPVRLFGEDSMATFHLIRLRTGAGGTHIQFET